MIRLDHYLNRYLYHPSQGYYARRNPLGQDYITSPHISQMFGECLAGVCVDTWQRWTCPAVWYLLELGPGQGLMMADILRCLTQWNIPLPQVYLYEASEKLKHHQRRRLAPYTTPITWISCLQALPSAAPVMVIANEFFDALPHRQGYVHSDTRWNEDFIQDTQRISCMGHGRPPVPHLGYWALSAQAQAIWLFLLTRIRRQGGGFFMGDYAYTHHPLTSPPLRAIKDHTPVPFPTADSDVSFHLDMTLYHHQAQNILGPDAVSIMTQGQWLTAYGIEERVATLKRCHPDQTAALTLAHKRLTHPFHLGTFLWLRGEHPPYARSSTVAVG